MTTLVLLHALGASGGSWSAVVDRLDNRFDCFAPDLPGFGGNADVAETGIAATLDWLAVEIAARAPNEYLLVGHSMGGKFATLLAARAETGEPGLRNLAGVVLLAGSPPTPEPMDESRRAEMVGWFTDGPAGETDARRFVEANVAAPLPHDLMACAIADVCRSSPAAWIGWLERGAREDWSDHIGRLATPALIVAGAEDGDLGEANQRRLNVPQYAVPRVVVVPHAAHLLPYEQPDIVAGLISDARGKPSQFRRA